MTDQFQVQTRATSAEVVLKNSTVQKGRLFLHEIAARHGGPERVEDVLNSEARFLPLAVRESGEKMLLINKAQVLYVKVPHEPNRVHINGPGVSSWAVQVSLEMVQGAPILGVVHFSQPPGRDRTLDGLNASEQFLCVVQELAFIFVNLSHVVSVRERGPQFESVPPPAP